jgi:hypothetical protein
LISSYQRGLCLISAIVCGAGVVCCLRASVDESVVAGTRSPFSAGEIHFSRLAISGFVTTGPELAAAAEILAVRRFPHDKRQPRAPRHRSERPTLFASEQDLTAAVIDSITHDEMHRPLFAAPRCCHALAGHPLELLRPPSFRA